MFESAVDEVGVLPVPGPDSAGWLSTFNAQGAGLAALMDALSVAQRHQAWLASREAQILAEIEAVEVAERAQDLAAGESPLSAPGWGHAVGEARERHWVSEEVGLVLKVCGASARDRMAQAGVLVTRLPATAALLAAGDLHPVQARRLVEAAVSLSDQECEWVQARVLGRAPVQSISAFCRSLRRALAWCAPRSVEEAHVQAMEQRRVVVTPAEAGMATLWALLPAPQALRIKAILDRAAHDALARDHQAVQDTAGQSAAGCAVASAAGLAEESRAAPGRANPGREADHAARLVDHRRADALVELVECGAAGVLADTDSNTDTAAGSGEVPADGPPGGKRKRNGPVGSAAPVIAVTVALSTLLGADDQPGELAGYGPIPASMARRLAADPSGTWRRLVTDPLGRLIDYGRERYEPPPDLAEFVRARDGVCAFPSCQRAAARCEIDHALDWELGGHTNEYNLGPLCPRHHHLKHDTDWTMDRDPDTGTTTWISATGHTYRSEPPDRPGSDAAPY